MPALNRQTLLISAAVGVALILIAVQLLRPLPMIGPASVQAASERLGPPSPSLPWPNTGSAAVAVAGLGTVATFGPQNALPMASIAKVMTASLVLMDHPLALATQGPMVPVTPADVATYQAEKAQGQSVFPVAAGEQLSEYQALQALLVPSGNNIADLLAAWDAGSASSFVDKMNARATTIGLRHTHFADASGLSPDSVGSPSDLIGLAQAAMKDPVFAEIVKQTEATLPVAGRVFNVDAALGQDGIIGVKTGSSSQAGACLLFAADVTADGQPARLFGVIMGLPTLDAVFTTTRNVVEAVTPALHYRSILSTDQVIGTYAAPWGDTATVFAGQDISWVIFDGMTLRRDIALKRVTAPVPSGSNVGALTLRVGDQSTTIPLMTTESIFEPDVVWRLTRLRSSGLF
jgi:D-alanyl-D-alanine carboxypeptidase (penicillin-binding protein 5/6)